MSARTLTRHFEREVGMSLRAWRQRVRLFKAIELQRLRCVSGMHRPQPSYSCSARK
ncbi:MULTISPECIES: hypothetical protein [unclassified Bradyrhizobium]|uniref:hypothetical protein n=1 Tax=unclassified Bradyrhizobium TaxID=2631580 RepID=UPI002FF42271